MLELLPVMIQAQSTGAYWGRFHVYAVTRVKTRYKLRG